MNDLISVEELEKFLLNTRKVFVGFYPRGIRGACAYTQEMLAHELAKNIHDFLNAKKEDEK